MRRGSGSKQKGGEFERRVCKQLSLWVSGGKNQDLFWRSAMSGGRATVARKKGVALARHAGDISATAPEGHALTDIFYIECKAYKDLGIDRLIVGSGTLFKFWKTTVKEAKSHDRQPMMIVRQNNFPVLMLVTGGQIDVPKTCLPLAILPKLGISVYLFEDVLKCRFVA